MLTGKAPFQTILRHYCEFVERQGPFNEKLYAVFQLQKQLTVFLSSYQDNKILFSMALPNEVDSLKVDSYFMFFKAEFKKVLNSIEQV